MGCLNSYIKKYQNSQFGKNILRSIVLYGFNTLLIFVSYPFYIHYLGVDLFSVWTLLSVIISFAELGNFGMGNALVSYVSQAYKEKKIDEISKLSLNAIYIILIPLCILFPALLLFRYDLLVLLKIPEIYYDISFEIIPYIYVIIVLHLVNDNLKAVIVGIGRLDLSNFIFVISNAIKLIFAIVLFICGFGLYAVVLSHMLSSFLFTIVCLFLIINGGIRLKIHRIDFFIQKKLLVFGSKMMGISVMNMLMMPISKILIAEINLSYVTYFEIGSKVVYAIFGIVQKGIYAFLPRMAQYKSNLKDNIESIRNRCKQISILFFILSVLLFFVLDLSAPFWMKLWLSGGYNIEILKAFYIIQIGTLCGIMALPYYYTLMGIGKENVCLYESIIRCVINIILLVFLIEIFSKYSVVIYISFTLATVFSNLYVLFRAHLFFKQYRMYVY